MDRELAAMQAVADACSGAKLFQDSLDREEGADEHGVPAGHFYVMLISQVAHLAKQ